MNPDQIIEFDPSAIQIPGDNSQQSQSLQEDLLEDKGLDLDFKLQNNSDDNSGTQEEIKTPPTPDEIKNTQKLFSVVLGQELKERGVISLFDEETISKIATEQDDATAISELIKAQIDASNNEIKSSYDKGYQEYLDLINGGVPKQDAVEIKQIEDFATTIKSLDLKADNQDAIQARKDLLTFNYKITTKWSDDKIQKYVDKLYDEGSDLDEIEEAVKNVDDYVASEKQAAIESAKQQAEAIKKNQEKYLSDVDSAIEKTEQFFEGEKLTKEVKQKMKELITTPVKLENGQVTSKLWASRMKDPIKWDMAVAYLEAIGYFDGKAGNKFIKSAESKVASGLQNWLSDNKGRSFNASIGKSFNDSTNKSNSLLDDALFK